MQEYVEFNRDEIASHLAKLYARIGELEVALAASEARERRLREALEGLAAQFDTLAASALERKYYPSTALRYNDWLRQFAYDTREALRKALAEETNDG